MAEAACGLIRPDGRIKPRADQSGHHRRKPRADQLAPRPDQAASGLIRPPPAQAASGSAPSLPTPADLDADPASHGLCCCPRRPRRAYPPLMSRLAPGIRRLQSRTRLEHGRDTQIGPSLPARASAATRHTRKTRTHTVMYLLALGGERGCFHLSLIFIFAFSQSRQSQSYTAFHPP